MADSIPALLAKFSNLASSIDKGRTDTVVDMASYAKAEFAAGPPRSGLRQGAKLAGKPWSVRYDLDRGTKPEAKVFYKGPVHWIDSGTDRHYVTPGGLVGSRAGRAERAAAGVSRLSAAKVSRGKKQAIAFSGIVRAYAVHPGTRPRPFWTKVKANVERGAPSVLQANLRSNIAKAGFSAAARFR